MLALVMVLMEPEYYIGQVFGFLLCVAIVLKLLWYFLREHL